MINKLVLGTAQFGLDYGINNSTGKPKLENVFKILDCAYESKVTELDTADAYGNSSEVLREYFKLHPNRFKVMSKYIADDTRSFAQAFQESLERLGLNELEGYYFHRFSDFVSFKEFEAVQRLKADKKIKMLGVSLYTSEELEIAVNNPNIDIIQLPLNLFDCDDEKVSLLKRAKEKKKKIYIRSVFLQGLFFMDTDKLPQKLVALRPALKTLNDICHEFKISKEALCLNYIHNLDFVDKVVIGVDSAEQVKGNIKELNHVIGKDIITKIESIVICDPKLLNPVNWN